MLANLGMRPALPESADAALAALREAHKAVKSVSTASTGSPSTRPVMWIRPFHVPPDRFEHVHRDADGAGLVGDLALGRGHQFEPEGADCVSIEDAHPTRGKDHQDALRAGRRQAAHARRSGTDVCPHPRAHPPDRSQGVRQAAAPLLLAQAPRLPRTSFAKLALHLCLAKIPCAPKAAQFTFIALIPARKYDYCNYCGTKLQEF